MAYMFKLMLALACVSVLRAQQKKIEHVVVVMLENRSFDHVLGFLMSIDPRINGLSGSESNPVNVSDPKGPSYRVTHTAGDIDPDAGHSVEATTEQVFGTVLEPSQWPPVVPMDGFVQNAERIQKGWGPQVMACFNRTTLPVISTLAQEFAVFDTYHASVPGPTEVNRLYLHSATSHGDAYNNDEHLILGYPQKTIFQKLAENNKTWGSYFTEVPTTLFFDWTRRPENLGNFHNFDDFIGHAARGELPAYSFVDPRYFDLGPIRATGQHPSHSMAEGELFLKEVYEVLRLSPLWEKTLLVITYDEHGGFYDHFPTPLDIPNPDGLVSQSPPFNFTRIGVRVPFIVASPWIEKGTVVHDPEGPEVDSKYEHSSVPATISKLFDLVGGPLTKRDAWAGTFEKILTRSTPRLDCPLVLPEPPVPKTQPNGLDEMSPLQEGFVQFAHSLLTSRDSNTPPVPTSMNEQEGGCYVKQALATFLGWPAAECTM